MDNDLISRSELRKHAFTMYQSNGVAFEPLKVVPLGCIDNAPTMEERPQGEWIELSNYRHECSICNNSADTLANLTEQLSNYCPNCGARMKQG